MPVATPIDYELNGSAVLNGAQETINGDFIYDPLTQLQYRGGSIQLTGPAPYAGQYICDDAFPTNGRYIDECIVIDGAFFTFANNLGSPADFDPLVGVDINGVTSTDTTGGVGVGPISAPEPTSLAILGAALGLFLVSSWAIHRH